MTGMKLKIKQIVIISMVLVCAVLFSACMRSDAGIDPGDWGYDCCVTYDALGGIINSREMREVYYMNNSYLFQPSGTTNMLVEPVKDGYSCRMVYGEGGCDGCGRQHRLPILC